MDFSGLDDLHETVSKLFQDDVLNLGGALAIALSSLSLGQQTAAHTFHHSRGYQ